MTLAQQLEELDETVGQLLDHLNSERLQQLVNLILVLALCGVSAFLLTEWFLS